MKESKYKEETKKIDEKEKSIINNNFESDEDEEELKNSIKKLKTLLIIQIVIAPVLLVGSIVLEHATAHHINYCPQAFDCRDCNGKTCTCSAYDAYEEDTIISVKCSDTRSSN